MIKKGTIVVRIGNQTVPYDIKETEMGKNGYIFATIKDNSKNASYREKSSIIPVNFRLATTEERRYFNEYNITNINQITELAFEEGTFCVYIGGYRTDFDKYLALCKEFGIKTISSWFNASNYYGTKDGEPKSSNNKWTKSINVIQFNDFLIRQKNKSNEKTQVQRKGTKNSRTEVSGRPVISRVTKQIAVGIRLTGNQQSNFIQKTRIRSTPLSRAIIF